MADTKIQQARTSQTQPELSDLLALWKKNIFLSLNCHHVGIIQSFDAENQTVTATVAYQKTQFERQANGTYAPILKSYPVLVDMPVIILQGGPAYLTMPIAPGDECLVLFNDRAIDNWFASGQQQPNPNGRMHSISDGFALVGVRSLARKFEEFDQTRATFAYGTTKVAVGEDKVLIRNEATTLNTILQSLVTNLQNLVTQIAAITVTGVTTGAGTSGPPANAVAITNIGTQIGQNATDLGSLLE
jgi:hypothetical protein